MSELFKICGVALICSAAAVIVGKSGGVGVAIKLGGTVAVLGLVLTLIISAVEYLGTMGFLSVPSRYFSVMLKALGVCVLCRVCSDVCRDCGDATASGAVESAAKLTLVLLSLPLVEELIGYAAELVERIRI